MEKAINVIGEIQVYLNLDYCSRYNTKKINQLSAGYLIVLFFIIYINAKETTTIKQYMIIKDIYNIN